MCFMINRSPRLDPQLNEPFHQVLLSLPARMAHAFAELENRHPPAWFATCDPAGNPLGSGGGTANVLVDAWRKTGSDRSFSEWLQASRKLVLHAGGQSRRLPAYAPVGKLLMPIPALRWARGQRLNQTLLDVQVPEYERVMAQAAPSTTTFVASGDVLLRLGKKLPELPAVDVLGLGIWATPETAQHFGVFFCPRQRPDQLSLYLQKPSPARIRELSLDYLYLVDTGFWLLSERATGVLLLRCGWEADRQEFTAAQARPYELYAQFGSALGDSPAERDPQLNALSATVVPLSKAQFFHLGANRQMIESISALQNLELDEIKLGLMGAKRHPDQYIQNSHFDYPLRLEENHTLWVENSSISKTWRLASDHILTGVPDNSWDLRLEPGVCLDFVPIDEHDFCVRFYGLDDTFGGSMGEPATLWLGRPAPSWFAARGIDFSSAGLDPQRDIQTADLFPVFPPEALNPRFLEWLFSVQPKADPDFARLWLRLRRLSACKISETVNLSRLFRQRSENRLRCLPGMIKNSRFSVFFKLDLDSTARLYADAGQPMPPSLPVGQTGLEPLQVEREEMFRAAVLRYRREPGWEIHEENSFGHLRRMIINEAQVYPVLPRCCVLADQIVWGRSPVRLDLAGGWTDTPPYCLENGGSVVNLAVDLNGQPPIQVFAKLCERPELVLRSIDLGVEQRVHSYEELDTFAQPGNEFALTKAALALVGFLPRFHQNNGSATLREQLQEFGGGIEVTLLSAVPKGSGLGTSSILAATVLATLSELCGLRWDREVVFTRTLALEQMLTTGGGWQDQAGGIFPGFKFIETASGLAQKPTLRWLPEYLFSNDYANKTILLFYTGITRPAKNILHEIVRGILLNSPDHLRTLEQIRVNAEAAFNAAQQADYSALAATIRTSWRLNQRLNLGTNPASVQAILDRISDCLDAAKLLGAGGGGYLLMLLKDADAATKVRRILTQNPTNARARFVDFKLSMCGLQLTWS